jgi:hypothetical protein
MASTVDGIQLRVLTLNAVYLRRLIPFPFWGRLRSLAPFQHLA